jgi:uncharacterized protein (TIGR03437 family)
LRILLLLLSAAALWAQIPVVTTIAGSVDDKGGVRGYAGDGGPAVTAALALANVQNECDPQRYEQNSHIFVDGAGDLYFADSNNHRIRRISPEGIITTVAGSGDRPTTNARCEPTSAIGDGGPARDARLYNPSSVIVLANGNLVIADQQNNRIRQVTPTGSISTIAGSGAHNLYAPGIPATASPMDWPAGLAVDAEGLIYFSEVHGNRIGRINSNGRLSTIAGNGFPGSGGDGGQATLAQLRRPTGITIDANGTLYIADTGNHRVRKVAAGTITTIAGTGTAGFSGDGSAATGAMLDSPLDVKVDSRGNVYIADAGNHRVRRIDPDGIITTVAGTGEPGRAEDFANASGSSFHSPSAIAIDSLDDLYVVDWQNYQIRKVTLSGLPAISRGGIVNAASRAPFPAPVAPGSLIEIRGLNFSSQVATAGLPLPTELGGVFIELNGNPIPIVSISPTRIVAQLPPGLEAGSGSAVVRTESTSSNAMRVQLEAAAPGIFQLPDSKRAIARNHDGETANGAETPEERGNTVLLQITGAGAVTPQVEAGQAAPREPRAVPVLPVTATVGGVEADVAEAYLQPGTVGVARVRIRIPSGIEPGDEVPVVIRVGGQESNVATISVR